MESNSGMGACFWIEVLFVTAFANIDYEPIRKKNCFDLTGF